MKPFEKYLNNSPLLRDLLEIYLELRQHLQEMGFSESELDNPPTYTFKMMRLQDRFQDQFNYLIRFMLDYGFDAIGNGSYVLMGFMWLGNGSHVLI